VVSSSVLDRTRTSVYLQKQIKACHFRLLVDEGGRSEHLVEPSGEHPIDKNRSQPKRRTNISEDTPSEPRRRSVVTGEKKRRRRREAGKSWE